MNWKEYINEVPDFPKPGVSFKDISPLLKSIHFSEAISEMKKLIQIDAFTNSQIFWEKIRERHFPFFVRVEIYWKFYFINNLFYKI